MKRFMLTAMIWSMGPAAFAGNWAWKLEPLRFEVGVPQFQVAAPRLPGEGRKNPCDGAEEQIRKLEALLVPIKAKYWAQRLKAPDFSMATLTHNPGSEIGDPEQKARFYALLDEFYYRDSAGPTLTELELFKEGAARIERIAARCAD